MYQDVKSGAAKLKKSKKGANGGTRTPLGAPLQETFGLLEKDDGQKESYDVEDEEDDSAASKPLPKSFLAEDYPSLVDSGPEPSRAQRDPCSYALHHMLDKCPDVSCCHQQAPSDPDGQVKLSLRQQSSHQSRPQGILSVPHG